MVTKGTIIAPPLGASSSNDLRVGFREITEAGWDTRLFFCVNAVAVGEVMNLVCQKG